MKYITLLLNLIYLGQPVLGQSLEIKAAPIDSTNMEDVVGTKSAFELGSQIDFESTGIRVSFDSNFSLIEKKLVVIRSNINMRMVPRVNTRIVAKLPIGTHLKELDREGRWYKVSDGIHIGYVREDMLAWSNQLTEDQQKLIATYRNVAEEKRIAEKKREDKRNQLEEEKKIAKMKLEEKKKQLEEEKKIAKMKLEEKKKQLEEEKKIAEREAQRKLAEKRKQLKEEKRLAAILKADQQRIEQERLAKIQKEKELAAKRKEEEIKREKEKQAVLAREKKQAEQRARLKSEKEVEEAKLKRLLTLKKIKDEEKRYQAEIIRVAQENEMKLLLEKKKRKEQLEKKKALRRKEKIIYSSFGRRDPFIPVQQANLNEKDLNIDQMKLVGIIWNQEDPLAVLEHRNEGGISVTLREGDKIANGKVAYINYEKITFEILEYGVYRSYTLKLVN